MDLIGRVHFVSAAEHGEAPTTLTRNAYMRLAICTFLGALALVAALSTPAGAAGAADFSAYQRNQVLWGATSLPVAAQLEYKAALEAAASGDAALAETHLASAIKLAPEWPDAYFTMSRIKFRHFDPDALYFLVRGVTATTRNFEAQSVLVLNLVLAGLLGLVLTLSIVLTAFALRYLPFVAHRPAELMGRRWRAALPKATAYLAVSLPFALFPGFITGACVLLLMTWHFMQRRERAGIVLLIAPFVFAGWFSSYLGVLSPIADPESFTNLAARSNYATGDSGAINAIARSNVPGLEADQHLAMGQMYLRREEYDAAVEQFLQSISVRPDDPTAYINLGNVYYAEGMWDKALEGYRKAVGVDSLDCVGQYNLAQAYIKTLLMAESSKALRTANDAGIGAVRDAFAAVAVENMEVYPRGFSVGDLWRIAAVEGRHSTHDVVGDALSPLLGFSPRTSAWMLFLALAVSVALSRVLKPRHLAFQCSNCGELMCETCGDSERGSFICAGCHEVIKEVTSEKVVDALLRSRRQKVVVRRRKRVRGATWWLPGLRDIFYGNLSRGLGLSFLFSVSIVALWTRGYPIPHWNSLNVPSSMWHWVVPAVVVVITYISSLASKGHVEMRNYRSPETRQRGDHDETDVAQTA